MGIGKLLGGFIKSVETKVADVEKTVEKDVGGAVKNVESAVTKTVDSFESNPTVKEATNFLSATLDSFETAVGLKKNPAEPSLSQGTSGTYTQTNGPLFVDGPQADDVRQGDTGDCYFLSSLASVAQTNPDLIEKAIKQNPDGTYTVTFHVPPGFGELKALGPVGGLLESGVSKVEEKMGLQGRTVEITVDGKLPTSKGSDLYAQPSGKGEIWAPIMEKAYAQLWGSYGAIGNGGDPATALYALTGKEASTTNMATNIAGKVDLKVGNGTPDAATLDKYFQTIKDAAANKQPMAATTYLADINSPEEQGLVEAHVYSVLGTSEHDGQKYVVLRNPWGYQTPGADEGGGVFEMPLADFARNYSSFTVGGK